MKSEECLLAHADLSNKHQDLPQAEGRQQQQNPMHCVGGGALNFLALSMDVTTSVLFKQSLVFKADQVCFLNIHFTPKSNFLFV